MAAATAIAVGCETAACAADYLPTPLIGCLYRLTAVADQKAVTWWTGLATAVVKQRRTCEASR